MAEPMRVLRVDRHRNHVAVVTTLLDEDAAIAMYDSLLAQARNGSVTLVGELAGEYYSEQAVAAQQPELGDGQQDLSHC